MTKTILVSIFFFMMLTCVCLASDDNQVFKFKTNFSFKLDEVWKLKVSQELRHAQGQNILHESVVSVAYAGFADWFVLGAGFKQGHSKSGKDWNRENRPYGEMTLKSTVFGLKCSDRNRLEYRMIEGAEDRFRYRNRLKIHIPYDLFGLPVQPYTAGEIFIEEGEGYYRNRIYAGLEWDVTSKLDIDFYAYRQRTDKSSSSKDDSYIFGFETSYSF